MHLLPHPWIRIISRLRSFLAMKCPCLFLIFFSLQAHTQTAIGSVSNEGKLMSLLPVKWIASIYYLLLFAGVNMLLTNENRVFLGPEDSLKYLATIDCRYAFNNAPHWNSSESPLITYHTARYMAKYADTVTLALEKARTIAGWRSWTREYFPLIYPFHSPRTATTQRTHPICELIDLLWNLQVQKCRIRVLVERGFIIKWINDYTSFMASKTGNMKHCGRSFNDADSE